MAEYICEITKEDMHFQRYGELKRKLVRCKDCIFRNTDSCITKHLLMDDFYCWKGTKKDGEPE